MMMMKIVLMYPILFVRREISRLDNICVDGSSACFFFYKDSIERYSFLISSSSLYQCRRFGHHIRTSNVGFQCIDVILRRMFSDDLILKIDPLHRKSTFLPSLNLLYSITNNIPFFIRWKFFQCFQFIRW